MEFLLQSLTILILTTALLYGLHFLFNSNSRKEAGRTSSGSPLFGFLPGLINNQNRLIKWTAEILSYAPTNTITLRYPSKPPLIMTANPSNVEYILNTNFVQFPKGVKHADVIRDVFGYTLFTIDGDLWKEERNSQSHHLTSRTTRVAAMRIIEQKTLGSLIPVLERVSEANDTIDIQEIFDHFMFDCICKVAFGADPNALGGDMSEGANLVEAFHHAESIVQRFHYTLNFTWKILKFFNIGHERMLGESISKMHKYMEKVVREKYKAQGDIDGGFLTSIFKEGTYSVEKIRDMCVGIVYAGKDTVASTLTWFFWVLSSNPRVENLIMEELGVVRARHNKDPDEAYTIEELREMHYLQAALTESMRLYPPVPIGAARTCMTDTVLPDGTHVKKGWCVTYNAYSMGSMEKIWGADSLEYKPERWLEDGVFRQKSQYQYPIFHGGPRICLGKELAYNEMKLITSMVMERFEIKVEARNKGTCPEFKRLLTLTMKDGLPVKVLRRHRESEK